MKSWLKNAASSLQQSLQFPKQNLLSYGRYNVNIRCVIHEVNKVLFSQPLFNHILPMFDWLEFFIFNQLKKYLYLLTYFSYYVVSYSQTNYANSVTKCGFYYKTIELQKQHYFYTWYETRRFLKINKIFLSYYGKK